MIPNKVTEILMEILMAATVSVLAAALSTTESNATSPSLSKHLEERQLGHPLRAYPNIPAARNAMRAQAKCRKAR
jgi:hypothetical protein